MQISNLTAAKLHPITLCNDCSLLNTVWSQHAQSVPFHTSKVFDSHNSMNAEDTEGILVKGKIRLSSLDSYSVHEFVLS